MAFTAISSRNGGVTLITLTGELDALTAWVFREEVERAAEAELDQLVLDMTELSYLSSAGLRGLVFARQKMADGVQIVLVGANDAVEQTIRLVGFHQSVVFSDRLPE
ncbi:STAS domain-containing protein [Kutzneria chonburiensis]|uniref:Anti-sigma factor antagonist n=1 Tax=Kutzneria chonburiensis TaxID=1483604 RepID=A0ABV6MYD2_9PSEU|nr:STAS domain-containing protein [Kutzneria chonburiensis]